MRDRTASRKNRTIMPSGVGRMFLQAVLGLLLANAATAAPRTSTLDLGTSVRLDDNLPNALDSRDREQDETLRLDVALRRPLPGDDVDLRLFAGAEKFRSYDDLDAFEAGAGLDWFVGGGRGYGQPSLRLGFDASWREHRGSPIRDGARFVLHGTLSTRLTDRLSVDSGARVSRRWAPDGAVFDTLRGEVFLRTRVDRTGGGRIWFETTAGTGELTSTVARSQDQLFLIAEALETDDAFGPGVWAGPGPSPDPMPAPGPRPAPGPGPGAADRLAYRLDGETFSARAGWLHPLGPRTSLEAMVGYRRAMADDGVDYDGLSAALFLGHRLR